MGHELLAGIEGVPAEHVKDVFLILLALSGVIVGWIGVARKGKVQVQPQPLEVVPGNVPVPMSVHTQCAMTFQNRLEKVENEIGKLREETAHNRTSVEALIRSEVGRVHARLDEMMKWLLSTERKS